MFVTTYGPFDWGQKSPTILTARFHLPSDHRLASVPAPFREFYAKRLRFESGARVRALVIANEYANWAHTAGAPWMGLRAIKRAMLALGHRHFRSNRSFFGDVQLRDVSELRPRDTEKLRECVEALAHAVQQLRLELGE